MAKNEKPKDPPKAAAPAIGELQVSPKVFVETLAGYGMEAEEIGLLMNPPVDGETIKSEFALELEMGPAKANFETLAILRAGVKKGNMTAAIWWTKARMGWSEKGPGEKLPAPATDLSEMPAQMHAEDLENQLMGRNTKSSKSSRQPGAQIHNFPARRSPRF